MTRDENNARGKNKLSAVSQKRHAVTVAITVTAVIIGFALGYVIGFNKRTESDTPVSIADYPTEQFFDAKADSRDTNNAAPAEKETSVENSSANNDKVTAGDSLPENDQQYIPWQFYIYEEPDFTSMKVGSSPPKNVQVTEKGEDGWALVETDEGEYWVYLDKNLYYIDRWVSLYTDAEGENAIEDLNPQIVEIVARKDNWLQINTEFGDRWVDPDSIRQSVRLDVPSYDQRALGYPLGCELVSLAMMMNYKTEVNISDLYDELPLADLPYEGFRGDPATSTRGWTIFPPALSGMMITHLGSSYDMSNLEVEDLREQLNNNVPILVWIRGLGWPVHALCLTGYDKSGFFYNDPWTGDKDTFITYDDFYEIWNEPIYDSVLNLTYTPRKALSYYP